MIAAWNDTNTSNVFIDKKEIVESFKKHAFSSELKEESIGDQVTEIIFRKLVEQSGIVSNEQNPLPSLTAEQSDYSGTKKQKYIS
jgi:hypothetical protein